MRYAVVENGVVANMAEVADGDEAFAQAQGWVAAPPDADIGDLYDGENFSKPEQ